LPVAIINYGLGNLRSVYNAIQFVGGEAFIAAKPEELRNASHIILPGVGAFGDGIGILNDNGWTGEIVRQASEEGKPFLGICLGMQLLARKGTEHGDFDGLGLIDGTVIKLETGDRTLRVPHIGWNTVKIDRPGKMYEGIESADCYFVHSYVLETTDRNVISGTSHHGHDFVASVEYGNVWGTQFHPEKSQKPGLRILKNFVAA